MVDWNGGDDDFYEASDLQGDVHYVLSLRLLQLRYFQQRIQEFLLGDFSDVSEVAHAKQFKKANNVLIKLHYGLSAPNLLGVDQKFAKDQMYF